MGMVLNFLGIVVIILGLIGYLLYRLRDTQGNKNDRDTKYIDVNKYTLKAMTEFIKEKFNEMTGSDLYDLALDEEDYQRQLNNRDTLKNALKESSTGNVYDKMYVKDTMFDLLVSKYGLDQQSINLVLPFEESENLTSQDKFEILIHIFKKLHNYKALSFMIKQYRLDELKKIIEGGKTHSYIITADEIDHIYKKEIRGSLSFEDKLQIIVQRIYQYYKGHGPVDEIRDMEIDGVSGGVSGAPSKMTDIEDELLFLERMRSTRSNNYNSIWIMFEGKNIHLPFLSFGSKRELKRVVQNIYKHQNPGQLTEKNGFIVNTLADNSRIVVMRPPFSESWAFFNRKFDPKLSTVENWFSPPDRDYHFENTELPVGFLPFLMKGQMVTAFTGDQGVGKTTLMMAMAGFTYGWLAIRPQEMTFELHLRSLYPERNILSSQETDHINGQAGMDVLKKSDGQVSIIGEIATVNQATWFLQNGKVAFFFTIISHHAKRLRDLVGDLADSLLKLRIYNDQTAAMRSVVNILNFDLHIDKNHKGQRFMERLTECVPIEDSRPLPDKTGAAIREYINRMLNPQIFEERDIIVFEDGKYVAKNRITDKTKKAMMKYMLEEDRLAFEEFLEQHWKVAA